jgi:AcrR family transcriptional regulator
VGLREAKAEKTRKRIVREALRLFKRDGYEQTKVEAIAEAAEVSASTIYRYFPSKDLILLSPVSAPEFWTHFSRHCSDHSVEEALAEAVLEWARWQDSNAEEVLLVRSLIDQAPIPRARLWDVLYESEQDLNARLAKKLHLQKDDLKVVISARLVFFIIGLVADRWRSGAGKSSSVAIAKKVMRMFEDHKVLLPQLRRADD